MPEPTTHRLAAALKVAGAPPDMISRAREGYSIAEGVLNGEWDATREESEAWAKSPDGQATFRDLLPGNRAQRRARQKRDGK